MSVEYIDWAGGPCPVEPETLVIVKYEDGDWDGGKAKLFQWEDSPSRRRVTSYYLLKRQDLSDPEEIEREEMQSDFHYLNRVPSEI